MNDKVTGALRDFLAIGGADAPLELADIPPLKAGVMKAYELAKDGDWHTADEIEAYVGQRESLRRFRQLRQWYTIEKRRITGVRAWEYRLIGRRNGLETVPLGG